MGKLLSCRHISFSYRNALNPALERVDFSMDPKEFVGIAGPTGAGKTTLVRCASGIVPKFYKGRFSGEVFVKGRTIAHQRVVDLAGTVGTVFQDFDAQLFSTSVRREMAFGMENLRMERETMVRRIDEVSGLVGLRDVMEREPQNLSGGQKQRLALASVLCLAPDLLLCDEPTTDLDPAGKAELVEILDRLVTSGGSVGIVEHDTERLIRTHRVVILDSGRVVAQGPPLEILSDPGFCMLQGLFPPQLFELFSLLELRARPRSVEEAKQTLDREGFRVRDDFQLDPIGLQAIDPPLISAEDVHFSYQPDTPVLKGISVSIGAGDFVCLLGQNGSGKTTLAKHFNAHLKPTSGRVWFSGRSVHELGPGEMGRHIGYVPQNPDQMLFASTVFEEVAFGLRNFRIPEKEIPQKVSGTLEAVGLAGQESVDPFVMTKGNRQKLAVAAVLACEPEMLILDEPTTGLDAKEQMAMMDLLAQLNRAGHTILIITHSVRVASAYARRVILMESGRVLGDGGPREIFGNPELLSRTGLVAPPCVRLGRTYGLSVLTVAELARAIGRRGS